MSANTIKDFLVSLGFQVDEAGARRFESVVSGAALKVAELGTKAERAGAAVVSFAVKVASSLDNLHQASLRTGATVEGIQRIGYAVSQVGGSAQAARGSLENLARFIQTSPGAERFLHRLGIQTRTASGQMRDMSAIFIDAGQRLGSMPDPRANQYAQILGLDENTLTAMRRGIGEFSREYSAIVKSTGFNADQAAASASRFMVSWRSFTLLAEMARDKIGAGLADSLIGPLDTLRQLVMDNFTKIESAMTSGVKRFIRIASTLTDGWGSLGTQTQELTVLFGGLTAAWWLLNSVMLASPITWVLGLVAAIVLLRDDYLSWKEEGKSFIQWERWKTDIDNAEKVVTSLKGTITTLTTSIATLLGIDPGSWSLKWDVANFIQQMGELSKMLSMIADLLNALKEGNWSEVKRLGIALWQQGQEPTPGAGESRKTIVYGPNLQPDIPGGTGVSIPDRNNNPGSIRPVSGSGFLAFPSAIFGWEAMKNQLMRYFTGKTTGRHLQSIMDIVSTWAPRTDKNDPGLYARQVAGWMGVSPTAALNLSDPDTMGSLMQFMARKEGYANWNSPLAYRAAGATLNQKTEITINGVSDPREAAQAVSDSQVIVNSRATQQLTRNPG